MMISHSFPVAAHVCLFFLITTLYATVWASPLSPYRFPRQTVQPYFPDTPASCPICARGYPSINSCAQAAPALANISSVFFNPGAFISVIKCACTDTFQSVFPQCADCFERTNQTDVLDTPNLPSLVNNIRQVCSFASSILGNASNSDGETTPSVSSSPSSVAATGTPNAAAAAITAHGRGDPSLIAAVSVIAGAATLIIIFGGALAAVVTPAAAAAATNHA